MMDSLRKALLSSPWPYVIAAVLAAAIAGLRLAAFPEGTNLRFALYDALSVSGYATFLVGALLAVAHFGAFDLFGYVFSPGRLSGGGKYKNYAQYVQAQQEKRSRDGFTFLPFFVVGIAVYLISLLLR